MVRANHVTEPIVRCLAEAGCYSMALGLESGNDRLRNDILKRGMTKREIIRACDIIRSSGIKLATYSIIGIPSGTLDEEMETLDLNVRCRPHYCIGFLLQPLHKTAIYEYASAHNLLEDDATIRRAANVNVTSCVKFRNREEKGKIENLQKLFPIISKFPSLKPLATLLVRLPLSRFYGWAFQRMLNYYDCFVATPPAIGLRNLLRRLHICK